MKRGLLPVLIIALLVPWIANAGGVNLAWDQCWPEGGTAYKCFACATDSGYHTVVGSFALDEPMSDFNTLAAMIDGESLSPELPAWWQMFNAGSCRPLGLVVSFDFLDSPGTACTDPWQGQAVGGVAAYQTALFPPPPPLNVPLSNRLRIKLAGWLSQNVALEAGVEYYAFKVRIRNVQTTGASACAGCAVGVCLALTDLEVYSVASGRRFVTPYYLANMGVGWQNAEFWQYEWAGCNADAHCPVPARSRTWGSIKALYR